MISGMIGGISERQELRGARRGLGFEYGIEIEMMVTDDIIFTKVKSFQDLESYLESTNLWGDITFPSGVQLVTLLLRSGMDSTALQVTLHCPYHRAGNPQPH